MSKNNSSSSTSQQTSNSYLRTFYRFTPSIVLQPNSILDKAEPLNLNLNLKIIGPESIVIAKDGIYTGVAFGNIIKIKDNGEVTKVAKTGTDRHCRNNSYMLLR